MKILICVLALVTSALFYIFLDYEMIGGDAGYYLSIAEDISRGLIPYRDVRLHYPPLAIYLYSIVPAVFIEPDYRLYLAFQGIFLLGTAAFVIIFLRRFALELQTAVVWALLYLCVAFAYESMMIVLEPFIVLFSLAACAFIFKDRISALDAFKSGFLLGIAFLCKHYAALLGPVLMIAVIGHAPRSNLWKMASSLLLGSAIPLAILLLWLLRVHGLDPRYVIGSWHAAGYGFQLPSSDSFLDFLTTVGIGVLAVPFVLGGLTAGHRRTLLLITAAGLIYMLPIFVRQYPHYFLLPLPFFVIILGVALEALKRRELYGPIKAFVIFALLLCFLRGFDYSITRAALLPGSEIRSLNLEAARDIRAGTSSSERTVLLGDPRYWFLAKLSPVFKSEVGYEYCSSISLVQTCEKMRHADKVVIIPGDQIYGEMRLLQGITNDDILDCLKAAGLEKSATSTNEIDIWRRKLP